MEKIEAILKENKLSITNTRISILSYFIQHQNAISSNSIEKKYEGKINRITIYRTLQRFVEKGIIHTIPTEDNIIRYAMCAHGNCNEHVHNDEHIHFECKTCKKTTCLEETIFPILKLPKGYELDKINISVMGICKHCNKN